MRIHLDMQQICITPQQTWYTWPWPVLSSIWSLRLYIFVFFIRIYPENYSAITNMLLAFPRWDWQWSKWCTHLQAQYPVSKTITTTTNYDYRANGQSGVYFGVVLIYQHDPWCGCNRQLCPSLEMIEYTHVYPKGLIYTGSNIKVPKYWGGT